MFCPFGVGTLTAHEILLSSIWDPFWVFGDVQNRDLPWFPVGAIMVILQVHFLVLTGTFSRSFTRPPFGSNRILNGTFVDLFLGSNRDLFMILLQV